MRRQISRSKCLPAAPALAALTLAAFLGLPGLAAGQSFIRVPQDNSLQGAINQVSNGGVIEVSAGTYPAPAGAFRMRFLGKGFTLRAAAGAEVILDGGGTTDVLRIDDSGPGQGRTIVIEGLTFRDGLSTAPTQGGAVTIDGAEVVFRNCRFLDSLVAVQTSGGGGGLRILDGSNVSFSGCEWRGNGALNLGGGMAVIDSTVEVFRGTFEDNRTNLPGHANVAAGGAIFGLDSILEITSSRFADNQAAWVGGAINVFGTFRGAGDVNPPSALVTVVDSTFVDNLAELVDNVVPPGPTNGGAIHIEDLTTLEIRGSRFLRNRANWGGAISNYRSLTEISDSVFRGNQANLQDTFPGAGGAINLTSADFNTSSTDFGAINRRDAELVVRDSLFQGRFGSVGVTGEQGGCLFANGDFNRVTGAGGVPIQGTPAENRAIIELERVILADCDVQAGFGPGFGGGVYVDLAELSLTDTLVIDSDAFDDPSIGGGVAIFGDSALSVVGSTFANNTADERGGAITANGAEVEIRDSNFLRNEVSPGFSEPIFQSFGAALFFSPAFPQGGNPGRDITGVVSGSTFIGNVGLTIVDNDSFAGPFNLVRYDDNAFQASTFGNDVYVDLSLDASGFTVGELNGLTVPHAGIPSTDKSQVPNRTVSANERRGLVLAAPTQLSATGGAPGDGPPSALLGFAWNGQNATLDGANLAERTGLREVDEAGVYPLVVAGQEVSSAEVTITTCGSDTELCLGDDRFVVEVDFRDFAGQDGTGKVVPGGSRDSGLFFFFDPDNWEILIKVLDGCGVNGHYWVFAAATTNVEYTLKVTDTLTGTSKSYFNPLGNDAAAITDTGAFPTCDARAAGPRAAASSAKSMASAELVRLDRPTPGVEVVAKGGCADTATSLCLTGERFLLEVDWRDFAGRTGQGQRVTQLGAADSGLFFFFDPDNFEMLVKVLNGCGVNGHYWVFAAATTNVEYTLTVTDTDNGTEESYFNPLGTSAAAITDVRAFATCP